MKSSFSTGPSVCLKPGSLYIGSDPCEVMTLLGSCVAVTMFSHRLKLAAMCHAMLAEPDPAHLEIKKVEEPHKYVSLVIPLMVEKFRCNGIDPSETEVKLFGGANVFGLRSERMRGQGIGSANILRARELLDQFGLRVAREHVGGFFGRKIIFNTETGIVWLKCLKSRINPVKARVTGAKHVREQD